MYDVKKVVNEYFCKHTIEEIKKIEQSTRLLVEQKKEDLRQMVGCVGVCVCARARVICVWLWERGIAYFQIIDNRRIRLNTYYGFAGALFSVQFVPTLY